MRCGDCKHLITTDPESPMVQYGFFQCPKLPPWKYVARGHAGCEEFCNQTVEGSKLIVEDFDLSELF